jgi:Na+/H+-dicarboxylate symporter
MKLWHKVTIGLFAGVIFGLIAEDYVDYVKPIGDIFINMIKMIVVPLIFFSIISGITSVSDSKSLGRIGIKATIAYLATTTFAICTGIGFAWLTEPGVGVVLDLGPDVKPIPTMNNGFSISSIVTSIVPTNAIGAMAEGNMIQTVFFAIFTGITLTTMGSNGKKIVEFSQHMSKLVFKMIGLIIGLAPYGAFALVAWVVGKQGIDILYQLMKLVLAVMFAMAIQYLIFGVLILVFARISPIPFYKKSVEFQTLAFSTSSTKAALATSMKVCQNKMGISNSSTSFILPLGASMNMDGMAIYLGMCVIFFAQAFGVQLSGYDYGMLILTATLGSIGGAGIPGGSMVMLPMILTTVGLPVEGVALIAGVDRILDMIRSAINITGDAAVTLIVDKTEGRLDTKTYYAEM